MVKKKYLKLIVLYLFLTLLLLGLIFKFGLKIAVTISEFLQKNKPLPTTSLSENILPSPQFYSLTEATNSATLLISGYSQPNGKVDIYLNDLNVRTIDVDSEGKFESTLSLSLGINKIYGVTIDSRGQQSPPSRLWTVFFQDTPPLLEVLEPANESTIKKVRDINIKGKVSNNSKVTINDHQVVVDNEGNFSYPTRLQDGENKFVIVCFDLARNKNETELVINFQP